MTRINYVCVDPLSTQYRRTFYCAKNQLIRLKILGEEAFGVGLLKLTITGTVTVRWGRVDRLKLLAAREPILLPVCLNQFVTPMISENPVSRQFHNKRCKFGAADECETAPNLRQPACAIVHKIMSATAINNPPDLSGNTCTNNIAVFVAISSAAPLLRRRLVANRTADAL